MAGKDFSHLTNDELIKGIQALKLPDYIRSKAYGIDVRETLAQMTEMTIQLGVNMGLSPDDALKWARDITAQLAQKANDNVVRKKTDPITVDDLGSDLITAIEGGKGTTFELLSIPRDLSVTEEKTTFINKTNNILDTRNLTLGGYYNGSGRLVEVDDHYYTDYIEVKPNTEYNHNLKATAPLTFYDVDKKLITDPWLDWGEWKDGFTTPNNAHYIRTGIGVSEVLDKVMIIEGEITHDVIKPYEINKQISLNIGDGEITPNKTSFIEKTRNILDVHNLSFGGYYNGSGRLVEVDDHYYTDYIEVKPNTTYVNNLTSHAPLTFYDYYKRLIVEPWLDWGAWKDGFTTPKNAYYIRTGIRTNQNFNRLMITDNSLPNEYVPAYQFNIGVGVSGSQGERLTDGQNNQSIQIETNESKNPLLLKNKYGYHQPYHPKVLYFENGWNGYKYWLVESPYPKGAPNRLDYYENPTIHKSNDGVSFTEGVTIEELTVPQANVNSYYSDPHLVYREDTNTLECWYRFSDLASGSTHLYRKTTTDGVTWTQKEEVLDDSGLHSRLMSPAIIFENGLYKMWYMQTGGHMVYTTSANATSWLSPVIVTNNVASAVWHFDIYKHDGTYYRLDYQPKANNPTERLVIYTSSDGLSWTRGSIILESEPNTFYSSNLYRASLLHNGVDWLVYFGGGNATAHNIGVMKGETLESLKVVDGGQMQKRLQARNGVDITGSIIMLSDDGACLGYDESTGSLYFQKPDKTRVVIA